MYDINKIRNHQDAAAFIQDLLKEFEAGAENWENVTLYNYLEAMSAWVDASDGVFENRGVSLPNAESWQLVAQVLLAATAYE